MDGWMDKWMDGWMDGWTSASLTGSSSLFHQGATRRRSRGSFGDRLLRSADSISGSTRLEAPRETVFWFGIMAEAVVTVRLVRSFEKRNFRPMVFREVQLDQSVRDFMQRVRDDIMTRAGLPPPFRKHAYDTMKIIHHAHGAKTNELVMSTEDDDQLILQEDQTLRAAGVGKSCSSFQSGRTLIVPRSTAFTAGTSALRLEIVCRRNVLHDSKVCVLMRTQRASRGPVSTGRVLLRWSCSISARLSLCLYSS
uniref:Uncharacterized protein n=1 Tax=Oryzias latipes TaxID=8090 RepID=A0A3P9H5C7_ORYLA